MALVQEKHLDIVVQGGMLLFMEIYLYFQEMYAMMSLSLLFLYMASAYRKAHIGSNVCIIVLGDIGRSPRMQYHASSFAKLGFEVEIVGYGGSKPHVDILSHEKINLRTMKELPSLHFLPTFLRYPMKVLFQSIQLGYNLTCIKWPSHILVQNPPTIPTIGVAWIIGKVYGSKFIIDWHNYGYTILGLSLGKSHALVHYAEKLERFFCHRANGHLCVTNAMKKDLEKNWGLKDVVTLYDRAPDVFTETSLEVKHKLLLKLSEEYPVFKGKTDKEDETAFTEIKDGEVCMKPDRPCLIISSTSWSEDEDFSILLKALEKYEDNASNNKNLPDIICAITGKGPQKKYYEDLISKMTFNHVTIQTLWLEAEDYPRLVGSADLGVCLHLSSSGLDLPMKVVDMFGCGVPVCAIHFNCLEELVKHGENGLVFHDHDELATQIQELLTDFPEMKQLNEFRKNVKKFQELRWEESWRSTVKPILYT